MNDHTITSFVSILLAVIGLAIIAVLVSNSAKTGTVLGAGGSAFGNIICAALKPIGVNCTSSTPSVTSTINFGGL